MLKKLRLLLAGTFMATAAVCIMPTVSVSAQTSAKDTICESLKETGQTANQSCASGSDRINSALEVVLNLLSIIAGVIAVIMLIIAGIRFVTSQGDPNGTKGARNAIIYACVGLIIVALSQVIVRFVLSRAQG